MICDKIKAMRMTLEVNEKLQAAYQRPAKLAEELGVGNAPPAS
jgi:hypothetical protein